MLTVGIARAVLYVMVGVIVVKQSAIEPGVQPAAPFAMQGGGKEMPDAGYSRVLEDDEQDQRSRIGENRR